MSSALVVENAQRDGIGRLGEWLTGGGLDFQVVRPHAGEPLPTTLDGYAALIVLGGPQSAYGQPEDTGASWFGALQELIRVAVAQRIPTLGICLGAQLAAVALGGRVEPAGIPEFGPRLVGKRDAAGTDVLFADVPLMPDVIQSHWDEITVLPPGAVLLAASPSCQHQAFRYGDLLWAVQFHLEFDAEIMTAVIGAHAAELVEDGHQIGELTSRCLAALDDVAGTWRPFAERFARLALGELSPRTSLPLLES